MAKPGNSPTVRRRQLGISLKTLRTENGWTVEDVAAQIGVSTSKVSRLENGHRGASEQDIRSLCDLYHVDADQREHLTELAREGKQRATWQPAGLPYSTYVGLEAEAALISDFGFGLIPGLLQTSDYARAVVRAAVPKISPAVVEQRVAGRMARQALLFADDGGPRLDAVIDEGVLHRVVGSPTIMRAQLERLIELSDLPSVTVRAIPYTAGTLPAVTQKFIVLQFRLPDMSDIVFFEGRRHDTYVDNQNEVEIYKLTFRALVNLAISPEATRDLILASIAKLRSR